MEIIKNWFSLSTTGVVDEASSYNYQDDCLQGWIDKSI